MAAFKVTVYDNACIVEQYYPRTVIFMLSIYSSLKKKADTSLAVTASNLKYYLKRVQNMKQEARGSVLFIYISL